MRYFIIANLLFVLLATTALAYECPFGRVNDPYPGLCALYTDNDNNAICDNGQDFNKKILGINEAQAAESLPITTKVEINYYITEIILLFIIFQLLGISLIQYKKLKLIAWRKINNYILLIIFLVTLATSMIYLGNLTGTWRTDNLKTISWLHIESGFIMVLFSVEHVVRRWRHFIIRPRTTSRLQERE